MPAKQHILMSLKHRHAENILSGNKRVELRRRTMHVAPGATLWIYVKLPVGEIVGSARIKAVDSSSPTKLWSKYGTVSGLSKSEFFDYFEGSEQGVALLLERTARLQTALTLEFLREVDEGFQPPQFFARLSSDHPLRETVTSAS